MPHGSAKHQLICMEATWKKHTQAAAKPADLGAQLRLGMELAQVMLHGAEAAWLQTLANSKR